MQHNLATLHASHAARSAIDDPAPFAHKHLLRAAAIDLHARACPALLVTTSSPWRPGARAVALSADDTSDITHPTTLRPRLEVPAPNPERIRALCAIDEARRREGAADAARVAVVLVPVSLLDDVAAVACGP